MNTLKPAILIPAKPSSKFAMKTLSQLDMLICQRYLCTTPICKTKRGAGKEQGKMSAVEINKMVENEKRGIFRQLDIGLPQQWKERKKFDDRVVVKAAPR